MKQQTTKPKISGRKTQEQASHEIGQAYYNEFVKPVVDKLDQQ